MVQVEAVSLVFYVQPEKQAEVREAMKELMYIPFSFEDGGSKFYPLHTPDTHMNH